MIRILKGTVSLIVVFSDVRCKTFYDIDGTVLGVMLPSSMRAIILLLLMKLPHRIVMALEQLIMPIKARIDRVLLYPTTKCFLTARTTKNLWITINELKRHFNEINVVVFRRTDVKINDYYKYVLVDLYRAGFPVVQVIVKG